MTTIAPTPLAPTEIWSSMPGWGIVADLTPPELIASRRLRVIRRLLVAVLALLVVLLGAGYGYARLQTSSASSDLAAEQSRTAALLASQNKYGAVTEVRGSIAAVQAKLAELMAGNVDLSKNLGAIRTALPSTMTLSDIEVTISKAGTASAAAAGGSVGSSLDTSGHQPIGKVTLGGSSSSITSVATFVTALQAVPGFIDVVPSSNDMTGSVIKYSVSFTMTDQVLTNPYAISAGGSK